MASFSDIAASASQFITGAAEAVQGVNELVGAVSGRAAPTSSLTQLQQTSFSTNGASALIPRTPTQAGPPARVPQPTSWPTSLFVVLGVGIVGVILFFVFRKH